MGISIEAARCISNKAMRDLRNDKAIRLMRLDQATCFYAHKGVSAFNTDWTSVTEAAALWRIDHGVISMGE